MKSEGRRGGCVVNVVALHALVEGSEAAAENGLAVAEEVFRESDARLQRVVVVGDQAARESILTRKTDAVEVERGAVHNPEARTGWIQ